MVRKIERKVSEGQLRQDLEKYRKRALQLGATDAKIITADKIIIDNRVLAKCTYPKCNRWGTNANCPPHAMSPEEAQKVVNKFKYAIFLKMDVPSENISGPDAKNKNLTPAARNKVQEIVARIEAEAFYDGYYLALGFACGSCKSVFCPDVECSALVRGQGCRFPLKARSSMEAVGMDAFAMATEAGWDIYPIGYSSPSSDIPHGLRLGVVLIE